MELSGYSDRSKEFRTTRRVAVLGATGSIGTATLDVIAHLNRTDPDEAWQAWSISGHNNAGPLAQLAGRCAPACQTVIASDAKRAEQLRQTLGSIGGNAAGCQVDVGPDALVRAASAAEVDTVVAAIVGRAGLESTLAAVQAGKRIALANKETLVVAGPVVTAAAAISGAELLPVDSEHSAIFQCLAESRALARSGNPSPPARLPETGRGEPGSLTTPCCPVGVRRLILTASGGPFRDWSAAQMDAATVDQALAHPTWKMGRKISIDSATMMNKSLEVIEAKWLFNVPADCIEVVVHPQSLIHSLVEFTDGSVVAQLSPPDMRLPIQYALTYPRRLPCPAELMARDRIWDLTLQPADLDRFPALALGFEVARVGGTAGVVVNGANETAVALFLDGQIRFTDIARLCHRTLLDHNHETHPTLSRLLDLDRWSRRHAADLAASLGGVTRVPTSNPLH